VNDVHFRKRHILIISGDPRSLAVIKMDLMGHFEISIAATSETAKTTLEMNEIAAIVIYIIGESRDMAFTVFTDVFELAKIKNIPIIFLAEKGNDDDETTAFAMGAVDYSTRRHGTVKALISRINLRIHASKHESQFLGSENPSLPRGSALESFLINKTILIAEDIEINRMIIGEMLSGIEGLVPDFAVNGKEAVEKFSQKPDLYTCIFMDIQRPEMDGLQATRVIRSLDRENSQKIPIIAMTAGTSEEEIKRCLEAGMNDFLEKPVVYEKMLDVAAAHCL